MKDFRQQAQQQEKAYREQWLSWLRRLLYSSLRADQRVSLELSPTQPFSNDSLLWDDLRTLMKVLSMRSPQRLATADVDRFFKEFGIEREIFFGLATKEERYKFLVSKIANVVEAETAVSSIGRCKSAETERKADDHQKKDLLGWLEVKCKYQYLIPKVKRVLVKSVYEPDTERLVKKEDDEGDGFQESWDDRKQQQIRNKIKDLKREFKARDSQHFSRGKSVSQSQYQAIACEQFSRKFQQTQPLQRKKLLSKYLQNQDGLTMQQMMYILDTSPLHNKAVDKKFVSSAVKKMNAQEVEQIELKIAQSIIRKFNRSKEAVKERRNQWKRKKIGMTVKGIRQFQRVQARRERNHDIQKELKKYRPKLERCLKLERQQEVPEGADAVIEPSHLRAIGHSQSKWPVSLNQSHPPSALFSIAESMDNPNFLQKMYLRNLKNQANRNPDSLSTKSFRRFLSGGRLRLSPGPNLSPQQKSLIQSQLKSYSNAYNVISAINSGRSTHRINVKSSRNLQNSQQQQHHQAKSSISINQQPLNKRRLFAAAIQNNIQLFKTLVRDLTMKEIRNTDRQGNTLLYYAVRNKNIEMVDLLLKAGSEVQHRCSKGETALHIACKYGNLEIINMLLGSAGKDCLDIKCDQGRLPFRNIQDCTILSKLAPCKK